MGFFTRKRGWLARRLGVDLTHSQRRYAEMLSSTVPRECAWLDVGCGRQLLPEWACPLAQQTELAGRAALLVGVDVDPAIWEHNLIRLRIVALAPELPFRDATFDLVTANMVVEHLEDPHSVLVEIRRILKPGGTFVFHTPNRRHFLVAAAHWIPARIKRKLVHWIEGREECDVFPTFYRLNTIADIRRAAARAGMEVRELRLVGSSGTFGRLGLLGWIELLAIKWFGSGQRQSNILCAVGRPASEA